MKIKTHIVGLALTVAGSLSFALPAYGWALDPDTRFDSNASAPSSDQVLIHKSTPARSGVYSMRRSKKAWHSARIAPRKPRKKMNVDSMAVSH